MVFIGFHQIRRRPLTIHCRLALYPDSPFGLARPVPVAQCRSTIVPTVDKASHSSITVYAANPLIIGKWGSRQRTVQLEPNVSKTHQGPERPPTLALGIDQQTGSNTRALLRCAGLGVAVSGGIVSKGCFINRSFRDGSRGAAMLMPFVRLISHELQRGIQRCPRPTTGHTEMHLAKRRHLSL